ncbi:MAG: sensor histidine kinase [Anaerolineae bacterium]|nr:sensor histidine kinase [Anaerolineae bacterium]
MLKIMRWFRTLQAQLILWAILPVTLVVIALAFTGVYAHQQDMERFVTERNTVVAHLIAAQIEQALISGVITPDSGSLSPWLSLSEIELSATLIMMNAQGETLLISGQAAPHPDSLYPLLVSLGQNQLPATELLQVNQTQLLVSAVPVKGSQWTVILLEPAADLIGPILRFSNLGPIVAAIAMLFSLLILTFGWRNIIQPLQTLARSTEHITGEQHSPLEQQIHGVAEIEELHGALRTMMTRIEGYEKGIRDYVDAMTEGQDTERTRLAHELHDGPVQTLITMGQRAEMAERMIQRNRYEEALGILAQLRALELQIVDELRRIISDLRPIYLDDLGLIPAIQMLINTAENPDGSTLSFEHVELEQRLAPNAELAVYRIAQQALRNALQHAHAAHITIRLLPYDSGLALAVMDDGAGFTPSKQMDAYTSQGHFGLVGIQERVRQLGGRLNLVSKSGEGTTVSVYIPIADLHAR